MCDWGMLDDFGGLTNVKMYPQNAILLQMVSNSRFDECWVMRHPADTQATQKY